MLTKEEEVGSGGDCIIGVRAEFATRDLPPEFKETIRARVPLLIQISAGGLTEEVSARGHPKLPLDHPTDVVVRKSDFVCGRTIAVGASKGAVDLSRKLIERLRNPTTVLELRIKRPP